MLDANILFAAFMRDSTTRKILLTKTPTQLKLYAPPFIMDEVYKYKDLLARKAMLNKNDVLGLILQLIYASGIEIIDYRHLGKFKKDAYRISPTVNDAIYRMHSRKPTIFNRGMNAKCIDLLIISKYIVW